MKDSECVAFLQWALPGLRMRWPGFRKVRKQVCKRIQRRMNELHLEEAADYRLYLENHAKEWSRLDTFCRISISRFYRDRAVFDLFRDVILPDLAEAAASREDKRVRCWSAGCASGEEVYSLTIIWHLCVGKQWPDIRLTVVGTDVDSHLIERAERGCYSAGSFRDFPDAWLSEAFLAKDSVWQVRPEFQRDVKLQLQDIRHECPAGPFDCILCRHLAFTYFEESLQREVLNRIVAHLRPGGWLVTGKQETLPSHPLLIAPFPQRMGIYRKTA